MSDESRDQLRSIFLRSLNSERPESPDLGKADALFLAEAWLWQTHHPTAGLLAPYRRKPVPRAIVQRCVEALSATEHARGSRDGDSVLPLRLRAAIEGGVVRAPHYCPVK